MHSIENTYIHDQSPSFSDAVNSDNAVFSGTLSIDTIKHTQFVKNGAITRTDDFVEAKFNEIYINSMKRGRNTFTFWTIVVVLLLFTIGNLILTLTIIGVLQLGKGIRGMELIPEEDATIFYGDADLDRVYLKGMSLINGFSEIPTTINGFESEVYVRLNRNGQTQNRVIFDNSGINFKGINIFEVKDQASGNTIFTTHRPQFKIPNSVNVLHAKAVSASKISSSIVEPLFIASDGRINIKGSEGILLDSQTADLQAEHHISLNSSQGLTMLEAGIGIYLDMSKVPIVSSEFGLRTGSVQYKICVCMPQGILFRIAIPRVHNGPKISCAHYESTQDPCIINYSKPSLVN